MCLAIARNARAYLISFPATTELNIKYANEIMQKCPRPSPSIYFTLARHLGSVGNEMSMIAFKIHNDTSRAVR